MILDHPVQTLMVQNALGQGFLVSSPKISYFLLPFSFYFLLFSFLPYGLSIFKAAYPVRGNSFGLRNILAVQGTEHQNPLTGHKKWTNPIYFHGKKLGIVNKYFRKSRKVFKIHDH